MLWSAHLLVQPLQAILELGLSPFVAVEHGLKQLFFLFQTLLLVGTPKDHSQR